MRLWVLSGLFLFLGGCLLSLPVKGSDSAGLEFLFPPQWSYEPDSGLFFLEIAPRNESGINSVRVFGGPEWKEEIVSEGRIVEKECREACFWIGWNVAQPWMYLTGGEDGRPLSSRDGMPFS